MDSTGSQVWCSTFRHELQDHVADFLGRGLLQALVFDQLTVAQLLQLSNRSPNHSIVESAMSEGCNDASLLKLYCHTLGQDTPAFRTSLPSCLAGYRQGIGCDFARSAFDYKITSFPQVFLRRRPPDRPQPCRLSFSASAVACRYLADIKKGPTTTVSVSLQSNARQSHSTFQGRQF